MYISQILSHTFKAVGALFLAGTLGACVDITVELAVLDENNGLGTTTMVMDKEFYDMSQQQDGGSDFCDDGTITLTDTTATCVATESGTFAELFESGDDDAPNPSVVSAGPGLVRVTFPTGVIGDELNDSGSDPAAKAMMEQFFEGHFITFKVSGAKIVESDMEISADGKSASLTIPFIGLVNGDFELPAETYAIVKVN